ncbi:FAD-binding and (Fe-S)-binding domain-containing protein [Terriglobus sp. ADX1]|uniref:FAD-binding and (Fe-S)-binding domain-containing protein n=1 Tax=Terriglobus sp. ADX1 TaxID=2794063 RepID=UPI002FE5E25E
MAAGSSAADVMSTTSPFSILQQTPSDPHPHERFSDAVRLEQRLRATVQGEVRFDEASRALYATDASNYRQVPIGLVIPKTIDDVIATVAACRAFGAPVLSRGGGTSLAGQCCNVAVVMDFSKYLNHIVSLDPDGRMAYVQPGIVLDALRDEAEKHELTFAPDPATHSRCTLGGMIGNNSCGVHALMGGKTVDNIEELDILLYDGTRMTVGRTTEEELAKIIAAGGRKGEIYAGLKRLRDTYSTLVRERFPDIPRRVSGYNLDQLLPENGFNVARALVGTEGTCVTILAAKCELKQSPQKRRLVALGFPDPYIAADHVPNVLKHSPIGLEGFDGLLVDFMLRKNLAVDDVKLLPEGRGFLLCEFGTNDDAEVDAIVERFLEDVQTFPVKPTVGRYSEAEAARVWKVRESGLGASVFVPGEKSGWEGWEDSAVPPEHLGKYLRDLFHLLHEYDYRTPMYGHFGQGCVHLRISFDLRTQEGAEKYRSFIDRAADIVLKYGGSFSGEHGDGQARACLLPKMFGDELMDAFREFKWLWDPTNHMNPGKLIDPVAVYDAIDNLRIGPGYEAAATKTWFTYPNDEGFAGATERCVGVGACRRHDHGTMCPSYMATHEEKHSTRGRAHLLWEMLHGDAISEGWKSEEIHDALDLCLSCKACKTECPVNVDMATWKSEFLAHYYEGKHHPLSHYGFGHMDKWASLASIAPTLANLPMKIAPLASLAKRILHIAPQRELPQFAKSNFRDAFNRTHAWKPQQTDAILWADTWNNYFHPSALHAAADLLNDAGYTITTQKRHICCGRPLYDFGFLDEAKKYLRRVLDTFAHEIDAGIPVIMLEPSCATVFRDELLNFYPNDERAKKLAKQTIMLSEALARKQWQPPQMPDRRIVVHGHCHQKTQLTMKDDMALLQATGAQVDLLDSGCCGMAGPFGFEKDKYEVSQTLAERVLMPAVRAASEQDIIVSNGFSCREQIAQNGSRRAMHLSEVLTTNKIGK